MRGIRIQNLLLALFIFLSNLSFILTQWSWPLLLFGGELGELFEPVERGDRTPQQRRAFNKFWRGLTQPSLNNRGGGWLWNNNFSRDWRTFGTGDKRSRKDNKKPADTGTNSQGKRNTNKVISKHVQTGRPKFTKGPTKAKNKEVLKISDNSGNHIVIPKIQEIVRESPKPPKYLGSRKIIKTVDTANSIVSYPPKITQVKSLGSRRKTMADFMKLDRIGNSLNQFGLYSALNSMDMAGNKLSSGGINGGTGGRGRDKALNVEKWKKISLRKTKKNNKNLIITKQVPQWNKQNVISSHTSAQKSVKKSNFSSIPTTGNSVVVKNKIQTTKHNPSKLKPNNKNVVKDIKHVSTNSLSSPTNNVHGNGNVKVIPNKDTAPLFSKFRMQENVQNSDYPKPIVKNKTQAPKINTTTTTTITSTTTTTTTPTTPETESPEQEIVTGPVTTVAQQQTNNGESVSEVEGTGNGRGSGYNIYTFLSDLFRWYNSEATVNSIGDWGGPTTESTVVGGLADPSNNWKVQAREDAIELAGDGENVWKAANVTKVGPVDEICPVYNITYHNNAVMIETQGNSCQIVITWHERLHHDQTAANTRTIWGVNKYNDYKTVHEPIVVYVDKLQ